MCGIFTLLNNRNTFSESFINKEFEKGRSRGPEYSELKKASIECIFGFHRLAINGLDEISNQPIQIDDVQLICNGEIYNYDELYRLIGIKHDERTTNSDCEIIIHLYKKFGIEQTLQLLDGVFAFVLCDNKISEEGCKLFVARDPYGIRPLYKILPKQLVNGIMLFSSELKMMNIFYNECDIQNTHTISHFQPGTYSEYTLPIKASPIWTSVKENVSYHSTGFHSILYKEDFLEVLNNIQFYLYNAVKKRVLNTDRPVACLLSGGLDSSLITALVSHIQKNQVMDSGDDNFVPVNTFSIGFEGSEDLKYAKIVADYLHTNHTEVVITEQEYFNAIPEVITAIETFDTTTIRASVGNYLLGKYISKHCDAKVIFNGDGSDELCGGYLYMNLAGNSIEFDRETRRLLKDIHMFDVLRSDKCISSNGLEPRTPFLDRSFVNYYLGIHPSIRFHVESGNIEKYLLRTAFSEDLFLNHEGKSLLPKEVLWRKKEAFSDGISKQKPLPSIIEDHIVGLFSTTSLCRDLINVPGNTIEEKYYRWVFITSYPAFSSITPYFWMPKYVLAKDPSAKSLSIYTTLENSTENYNTEHNDDMYHQDALEIV